MPDSQTISFSVLGGGGEVGANCFELSVAGQHVILDSGTHPKKDGIQSLPELSLLRRAPDALLVSHAHVDHCGSVPYLVRQFPSTRVHCTFPTMRIMDRMLHNSVSVMTTLARERGIMDYPLYQHEDVNYAMQGVKGHDFEKTFLVGGNSDVQVTFWRAGHVLGAASILLETPGHNIFYTGDICQRKQELLPGMKKLDEHIKVDTLVIESTHGATIEEHHPDYDAEIYRLGAAMAKVLARGGTVMVPSFALGRMQEMLNIIARLQDERVVPDVPVYASGMGRAIYEIYDRYYDYLRPDCDLRPLSQFGRIGNVWEPGVVQELLSTPSIVVATSGMMLENTPSALIAEMMVQDDRHGIFFVGYLDHETLGYRLLHADIGAGLRFRLNGEVVTRQMRDVERFYFSAHAPRVVLRDLVKRLQPKNVIYVHGDQPALDWMMEQTNGQCRAYAPAVGQHVTIGI
jgi:cleavage and polyadenylation specificity factor subunit 3